MDDSYIRGEKIINLKSYIINLLRVKLDGFMIYDVRYMIYDLVKLKYIFGNLNPQ